MISPTLFLHSIGSNAQWFQQSGLKCEHLQTDRHKSDDKS